ncbi:hypothetical protein BH10PSE13_BH10PSE13_14560 [soil metagenome]
MAGYGLAGWQRSLGLASLLLASLPWTIGPASALTVTSFREGALASTFGQYAPGGDCTRSPRITVDATGLTFAIGAQTLHPPRYEWAVSYGGQDYQGISQWVFPFPKSEDDFGPVLMTLNANEKPGRQILLENNAVGALPAPYAILVKASPYLRCGKAPAIATPKAVPVVAEAPAIGLEWTNLAQAAGGTGNYSMLERGGIAGALKALLGAKIAVLETNLSASSPLTRAGPLYYLSGNAEHRGGYDMAYVILDPAQRALEVGLWEGGKLTVYRSAGKRVATPAEIAKLRSEQPPEEAVAAPGPPWQLRPVQGHPPLALGIPAASPHIDTISLLCNAGQPILSMKLYRAPAQGALTLAFVTNGGIVNVAMRPADATRIYWTAVIGGSPLLRTLAAQRDQVYLRIDAAMEGEINPQGIGPAARQALGTCMRF